MLLVLAVAMPTYITKARSDNRLVRVCSACVCAVCRAERAQRLGRNGSDPPASPPPADPSPPSAKAGSFRREDGEIVGESPSISKRHVESGRQRAGR